MTHVTTLSPLFTFLCNVCLFVCLFFLQGGQLVGLMPVLTVCHLICVFSCALYSCCGKYSLSPRISNYFYDVDFGRIRRMFIFIEI